MKIIHRNSPKAGTVEHLPPLVAQTLIAAGLADAVPYKNFQERLAAEQAERSKTATPAATSWGVQHVMATGSSNPSSVFVVKTAPNGDVTFFNGPPKDCPPEVVARFRKEAAVYEQIRQDQKHAQKVAADKNNVFIPGSRQR